MGMGDWTIRCDPATGSFGWVRVESTDGGRNLAKPVNRFSILMNKDPDVFQEFMEFLEETQIHIYGISIRPSKLRRLKHELDSRNLGNLVL